MHGRSGREKLEGNVVIQSYNPDNFSIQCAKKQNYKMFFDTEIALRKQLKYPPFCDIIVISFNSLKEEDIKKESLEVYKYLINHLDNNKYKIFKPMPAPIDKIQNRYRWRIIIKGIMENSTNEVLNNCLKNEYEKNLKTTKISIDVNPNNMM